MHDLGAAAQFLPGVQHDSVEVTRKMRDPRPHCGDQLVDHLVGGRRDAGNRNRFRPDYPCQLLSRCRVHGEVAQACFGTGKIGIVQLQVCDDQQVVLKLVGCGSLDDGFGRDSQLRQGCGRFLPIALNRLSIILKSFFSIFAFFD